LLRTINHGLLVIADLAEVLRLVLIGEGWFHGYREQDPSDLLLLIANRLGFVRSWSLSQQLVPRHVQRDAVVPIITLEHVVPLEMPQAKELHDGADDAPRPLAFADCLAAFADSLTDRQVQIYREIQLNHNTAGQVQMKRFRARRTSTGAIETYAIRTPLAGADRLPCALFGVILHIGGENLNTGHYHAYVVRNGRMYCCNDARIMDVTGQPAWAQALADGYLYFYRNP
jgi:hypothetical protein